MDEAWVWIIVFLIGIAIVFYVLWIALALLMRLVSFLVFYWVIAATVAFLLGIAIGFWLPLRVLKGNGSVTPRITTPDEVTAGSVVLHKARGAAKYYGWDHAWPLYVPYQAVADALAVIRETNAWLKSAWRKARGGVATPQLSGETSNGREALENAGRVAVTGLPGLFWLLFVPIPFAGLWVGVWVSVMAWWTLMALVGSLVYLCQQTSLMAYRWVDVLSRRWRRASLKCHMCYAETTTPSYCCKNPACSVIHRQLMPGPLGVLTRRCSCGTQLPTTVYAASKSLKPVCPTCNQAVLEGSGTRMTVQLPVIGSVGAGKTRLLATGLVGLKTELETAGGNVKPLNNSSDRFLETSERVVQTHQHVNKTQVQHRPEGMPLLLADGAGNTLELHLMDAAGESFVGWEHTNELRYLDSTGVLLLVLDPLAFADVRPEAMRAHGMDSLVLARENQEEAYASVVDRLRAEKVRLDRRHLGVVLTKADVLMRLPSGDGLQNATGEKIEQWLLEHGQDLFVRRLRKDFKSIAFFLIDSFQTPGIGSTHDPASVFQWALKKFNAPLQLPDIRQDPSTVITPTEKEVAQ